MSQEATEPATTPEPAAEPSPADIEALSDELAVALGAEPRVKPEPADKPAEPDGEKTEEPADEPADEKPERFTISRARKLVKAAKAKEAEVLAMQQRLEAQQQEILRYQQEVQQQRELVQRDPRAYLRQLPVEIREKIYTDWTNDRLTGGSDAEQEKVSPEVAALRAEIEATRKWREEQEVQQKQAQQAALYNHDVGVVHTALREKASDFKFLAAQPDAAQQAMITQAVALVHKHGLKKTAGEVLRVLDQQCETSYRHVQERLAPPASSGADAPGIKPEGTAGNQSHRRSGRKAGSNSGGLSNKQVAETRGAGREPTDQETRLEADDLLRGVFGLDDE